LFASAGVPAPVMFLVILLARVGRPVFVLGLTVFDHSCCMSCIDAIPDMFSSHVFISLFNYLLIRAIEILLNTAFSVEGKGSW